jgi:uncharacterized protein with von Willebrand factor type A (vWA) domain
VRSRSTFLRGVDRATFTAALASQLRRSGLPVSLTTTGRFAAALDLADPRTREELYWAARTCFLDDVEQVAVFDRVFDAVFDPSASLIDRLASQVDPPQPPALPPADPDDRFAPVRSPDPRAAGGGGVPWITSPSASGTDEDGDDDGSDLLIPRPSALADRVDVPFAELDTAELAQVGAWLEAAVLRWPRRRARRHHRTSRGPRIDRRRTLRQGLRTAGEPIQLVRTRPVLRPRGVVMLADVSGSMQPHARAYLHLMRALSHIAEAETFAFSTRLTRLTPTLRHRDVRAAIERATEDVDDRFTGTRIAASVGELLRHPVWNTSVRGAIVVIASDGWDSDPPEELAARMRRLQRLAHRVVWVNPRSATEGFEPLAGGMRAAAPHCDAVCSGHSLAAVEELFSLLVRD